MKRSSMILLLLGAIMVIALVVLTGPAKVVSAMGKAKPEFVILSLLALSISLGVRARKWQILINETGSSAIGFRVLLPVYLYNNMISNFTPAKTGDFLWPLFFKKYTNTSIGTGVSVILVDRVMEIIFLTIGLLISGSYFSKHYLSGGRVVEFLVPGILLFTAIITGIMIFLFSRDFFSTLVAWLESRNLPPVFYRWLQFFRQEGKLLYAGLRQIKKRTIFLSLFPLTALSWLFDILTAYFMFCSVLPMDFIYLAMTFFINVGISLITFIPLGLGAGELSFYYFLQLHGYDKSIIVVGILLSRCLPLALLISSGMISLVFLKAVNVENDCLDRSPKISN